MRIGIVTFSWSFNCGSLLQAFALREYLKSLGHYVEIVNFSSAAQRRVYSNWFSPVGMKNFVRNALVVPAQSAIKRHYENYESFIKEFFDISSDPYTLNSELSVYAEQFDLLIAGGDQVWNVACDDFDDAYMLNFCRSAKKISYSPSLGATDLRNSVNAEYYRELLEEFEMISCREPNGVVRLEELTGRLVELIPDPTLLFEDRDWLELMPTEVCESDPEKYIFYYSFSYKSKNNKAIQKLAAELDMKVVVIDAKQWFIHGLWRYPNFVLSQDSGPLAFMRYMRGSAAVITSSFHGATFSILLSKSFVYLEDYDHDPNDDRSSFLLEQFDLLGQKCTEQTLSAKKLFNSWQSDKTQMQRKVLTSVAQDYIDRALSIVGE